MLSSKHFIEFFSGLSVLLPTSLIILFFVLKLVMEDGEAYVKMMSGSILSSLWRHHLLEILLTMSEVGIGMSRMEKGKARQ